MRRILLAVVSVALAIPATASAAITHVYASVDKTVICVEDASVSQLTFQVQDSTGQLIESSTANAQGAPCPGGSGTTSFIPPHLATGYPRFPFGATIKLVGDGAPLAVPMPVAAWDSPTNTTRLKNVLAGSSVSGEGVSTTVGASGSLMITTTSADPLTIGETLSGGAPFTAVIPPRQFAASIGSIRNSAGVSVNGLDPTGARGTATLRSASGKLIASAPLDARVGADEVASVALNGFIAGSGDTITVSQPNWFSHTIRAASASLVGNGFNVSVPTGGETATYSPHSPDTTIETVLPRFTLEKTSDPALACEQLGPSVSCLAGSPSARYSVAARGFYPVAGDTLNVVTSDPGGDSLTYKLWQKGGWGSLDDGNVAFFGQPGTDGIARIKSGHTKLLRRLRVTAQGFTPDNSTGGEPFKVQVANGARVTFSGPGFAGFKPYTFRLSYKVKFKNGGAGVVSGVTYPHGEVLVVHGQVSLAPLFYTFADARGRFSVTVPDVRRGDAIDVAAVQRGGHGNWITTTSAAGALHPQIHGPADRAVVKGLVRYTVTGVPASVTWTLYLPDGGARHYHGRAWRLNASRLAKGIYRIEVVGPSPSMIDYRYLIVRH